MAHIPERKRVGTINVTFSGTGNAASSPSELPFEQLRDYRLLEPLGRGGMGSVYRAVHTRLEKEVAIKIIANDRMCDPQAVARFEREMKAVGKLDHPNIVAAYDAGEVNGIHFLVMELVPGLTLSRLVEHLGPLTIADACELACQAAVGLQFAQSIGWVHRDIKPSNLILSQSGQVKILDFGLAILREDLRSPELTATGETLGTIDYIAPRAGR